MKYQDLLEKMKTFCAYQERSEHEVERRLKAMWVDSDKITGIIADLKNEDYLNEKRFLELFVRSKVNQKRWGEKKIRQALSHHFIEPAKINREIEKIDTDQYRKNLEYITGKKYHQLKDLPTERRLYRLKTYLYMMGYDMQLINEVAEPYEQD
ncbi:MAG: RecX family transcriptional regulator [Clostridia bacterium]|nr:RecX family transcriptional regulator [Clostridia bacterium]